MMVIMAVFVIFSNVMNIYDTYIYIPDLANIKKPKEIHIYICDIN
jgi:hypothetical protein